MSNSRIKTFTAIFIITLLSAVVFSGGCGGGGSSNFSHDSESDPDGQENYSSEIAERLIARSEVYSLQEFVMDSSLSVDKGNVLLWYPDDGENMRGYPDLIERLNAALEAGAILAFVDVPAGDIDYFTDKLPLNLPNYLPDDAAS